MSNVSDSADRLVAKFKTNGMVVGNDIEPFDPLDGDIEFDAPRMLYVETAGFVKFMTEAGNVRTVSMPNAFLFPVLVTKIYATGTTALGVHSIELL